MQLTADVCKMLNGLRFGDKVKFPLYKTRQAIYVLHDVEALSCNQCCSGKAVLRVMSV